MIQEGGHVQLFLYYLSQLGKRMHESFVLLSQMVAAIVLILTTKMGIEICP